MCVSLFAQEASQWKNYTNMGDVVSGSLNPQGVWVASTGGVFFHQFKDSTYLTFNKSEGLRGIGAQSVTRDSKNRIWVGYSDGTIDVLTAEQGLIRRISDIVLSPITNKSVNSLSMKGDTVVAATAFGIVLINSNDFSIYDSYRKFGSFNPDIATTGVLFNGKFVASTTSGFAVQVEGALNLSAPESWVSFVSSSTGRSLANAIKTVVFRDSVLGVSPLGFFAYNGTAWNNALLAYNGFTPVDVFVSSDTLFTLAQLGGSGYTLSLYHNGEVKVIKTFLPTARSIMGRIGEHVYIATAVGVAKVSLSGNDVYFQPTGPAANRYQELAVDGSGTLWVSSGKDGSGNGVYSLNAQGVWKNYTPTTDTALKTRDYWSIHAAPDGAVYSGTWGRGFTRFKNNTITNFTAKNTPMVGINNDPNFVVITSLKSDAKGNLWVLNLQPGNNVCLIMLSKDSVYYQFTNRSNPNQILYRNLAIDSDGTKWFTNDQYTGIYYFNESNTPATTTDDKFGFLSQSDGLVGEIINDIVVDQRGDLWVGTQKGLNIVYNSRSVITANKSVRVSYPFFLKSQVINAIAVDPINRKWLATSQGLYLVSADASNLLAFYDSKNSPLLDDEILSVSIDNQRGRVYVATVSGITSFTTPASQPAANFENIKVYPSPLEIGSGETLLTIDGLMKSSSIKIISLTGVLIRALETPGGRIGTWDGRNTSGEYVASGVYIVVGYDEQGNNVGVTKVAVIKK